MEPILMYIKYYFSRYQNFTMSQKVTNDKIFHEYII